MKQKQEYNEEYGGSSGEEDKKDDDVSMDLGSDKYEEEKKIKTRR